MALDTYANLKTAIATLLNRDDLTSAIPDFIALCEADMSRKVRHWRMETKDAAFTIDARFEDLPTDWMETNRFFLATDPYQELELLSLPVMQSYRYQDSAAGKPRFYAHVAGQFEFYPTPDASYTGELVYLAKIPDLATNTTNWLLTNYPDAYLYGAALHSAPYLRDDERMVTWAELYKNAINTMNEESDRAKSSGTGLRIRTGVR